ncbi:hypothetical protein EON62_00090 [archaeon]|nr:MAG: hypothetical protein EON62_00090 [archaeon]
MNTEATTSSGSASPTSSVGLSAAAARGDGGGSRDEERSSMTAARSGSPPSPPPLRRSPSAAQVEAPLMDVPAVHSVVMTDSSRTASPRAEAGVGSDKALHNKNDSTRASMNGAWDSDSKPHDVHTIEYSPNHKRSSNAYGIDDAAVQVSSPASRAGTAASDARSASSPTSSLPAPTVTRTRTALTRAELDAFLDADEASIAFQEKFDRIIADMRACLEKQRKCVGAAHDGLEKLLARMKGLQAVAAAAQSDMHELHTVQHELILAESNLEVARLREQAALHAADTRKEEVLRLRRELMVAGQHISKLRSSLHDAQDQTGGPPPLTPGPAHTPFASWKALNGKVFADRSSPSPASPHLRHKLGHMTEEDKHLVRAVVHGVSSSAVTTAPTATSATAGSTDGSTGATALALPAHPFASPHLYATSGSKLTAAGSCVVGSSVAAGIIAAPPSIAPPRGAAAPDDFVTRIANMDSLDMQVDRVAAPNPDIIHEKLKMRRTLARMTERESILQQLREGVVMPPKHNR